MQKCYISFVFHFVSAILLQQKVGTERNDLVYALLPAEWTHNVREEEVAAFQSSISQELVRKHITVQERSLVATILWEVDLATALAPEKANRLYRQNSLTADVLVVPSICKLENDFFLILRQISCEGKTVKCSIRKTRLPNQFSSLACELVSEQFSLSPSTSHEKEAVPHKTSELRNLCLTIKSNVFFPKLWERTQILEGKSDLLAQAGAEHYYAWMLQLTAIATSPPEGMVFIPGGWVPVKTANSGGRTWVEPFFCNVQKVTVKQYQQYLRTSSLGTVEQNRFKSITDIGSMNPMLPVTGISWLGANAYANYQGEQLPSYAQWLRAITYLDEFIQLKQASYPSPPETSGNIKNSTDSNIDSLKESRILNCFKSMWGGDREWTSSWDGIYQVARGRVLTEPEDGFVKIICGGISGSVSNLTDSRIKTTAKPGESFSDVGFRCIRPFFRHGFREDSANNP